jgi:hypothetical protein
MAVQALLRASRMARPARGIFASHRKVMVMARPEFMDGPGSEELRQRSCGGKCGPCESPGRVHVRSCPVSMMTARVPDNTLAVNIWNFVTCSWDLAGTPDRGTRCAETCRD